MSIKTPKMLKDCKVLVTTGVKGGIGKTFTAFFMADMHSRIMKENVVIINCDARISSIGTAYRNANDSRVSVVDVPLFDDRSYEEIIKTIENSRMDFDTKMPLEEELCPCVIVDMPGQHEGTQHLEFIDVLTDEFDAALLWLIDADVSCIDALEQARVDGMKPPVPCIAGVDRKAMHQWHRWVQSDVRKAYGYSEKNELWIEELPSNLLPLMKEDLLAPCVIVNKGHPAVTSLSSRGMSNFMTRFARDVERVEVLR